MTAMSEKKKILIVNDRISNVRVLRERLDSDGSFEVTLENTIDKAVGRLEEQKQAYDLAILDLHLPVDWGRVEKYRTKIKNYTGSNQGELLACHLDQMARPLNYLFYVRSPNFYQGTSPGKVLQDALSMDDIVKRIREEVGLK